MALASSETENGAPGTRPERNSFVPPYWQQHQRTTSHLSSYSADNGHPPPIALEDHTEAGSDQLNVLWCKGVTIDDYVVVSGTAKGLGAYVVWNCTVETLDVSLEFACLYLMQVAHRGKHETSLQPISGLQSSLQ